MMKRISALLLMVLICMSLLTGCQTETKNYVRTAQLEKKEEELLRLTHGNGCVVFEFQVKDATRMMVDTYYLQNGRWVESDGPDFGLGDGELGFQTGHRMALISGVQRQFGLNQFAVQMTNDGCIGRYDIEPRYEDSYPAGGSMAINQIDGIQLGEPVPLMVFYGYEKGVDSHETYTPESAWENPERIDAAAAQLVTVTFDDKPVSEWAL